MSKILVTGGAGYIGSQMVRQLLAAKHRVVVVDTMEFGHQEALPAGTALIKGDISDRRVLNQVFSQLKIEAVIHFAGFISMEESVKNPRRYMQNNVISPITLLEAMYDYGVKFFIFSSTAGVYGNPIKVPIPEDHPKNPLNPYGLSKWTFEEILRIYSEQRNLHAVSLRYFNAAGASLDGNFGEDHHPETHIIPLAISAALGAGKEFCLYGSDYPTRDGTCVRDYIHVEDLCAAHFLVLEALFNGHQTDVYNVGTGHGVTNLEVIEQIKKENNRQLKLKTVLRRPGDAAELIADSAKLQKEF